MPKSKPILVYNDFEINTSSHSWKSLSIPKHTTFYHEYCPYCGVKCVIDEADSFTFSGQHDENVAVCPRCGWWSWKVLTSELDLSSASSARAILKKFAVNSDLAPLIELSSYLEKHNEKIGEIAPKKMEELTAKIYKNVLGHSIEFCSYGHKDHGIDIICIEAGLPQKIAIQVKRHKNPIELGYIHQLCGAMIDARIKKGIFVTSGRYRSGCYQTVKSLEKAGIEIDLVDGNKFLDFLGCLNSKKTKQINIPFWGVITLPNVKL